MSELISSPPLECATCKRFITSAARTVGRTSENGRVQPETIAFEPCGHKIQGAMVGIWLDEAREVHEAWEARQ
jgi:hypothetical protein